MRYKAGTMNPRFLFVTLAIQPVFKKPASETLVN